MSVVKELPVRRVNEVPSPRASARPARDLMSESVRNRIAWTVAGLSLLALVLVMRVLLPPPAMAGVEAPEGAVPFAKGSQGTAREGAGAGASASGALPATAAEAERDQEAAAAAAARAVEPRAPGSGTEQGAAAKAAGAAGSTGAAGLAGAAGMTTRPDYVSALEWEALKGVAAQSRDPARTLTALVEKLRFSKQLELFRGGSAAVPRADLAAQLLADLPARVAAGDMSRDEALRLLPALVEPLEPDPASRAVRVRQEAAGMPGQALQAVP